MSDVVAWICLRCSRRFSLISSHAVGVTCMCGYRMARIDQPLMVVMRDE